jgi:hypothetical protein
VKIRRRNRRTLSSQARQSTLCQSKVASSGPFTAPTSVVVASNLSFGSGASVIFLFTGSPDRVSTLSGPGTTSRIRPVIRDDRLKGPAIHVPVSAAFRPPAFASRSSDSRRGLPPSSRSAYRPEGRTPTGLPRSTRTSCDRGGCPLYPEDGGALPGLRDVLSRRLPLHGGQSLHPAPTSHRAGLRFTRHQREFKQFTRPVFPSPEAPGWNGRPLGFPPSFAPRRPGAGRRTSGAGTGHRART